MQRPADVLHGRLMGTADSVRLICVAWAVVGGLLGVLVGWALSRRRSSQVRARNEGAVAEVSSAAREPRALGRSMWADSPEMVVFRPRRHLPAEDPREARGSDRGRGASTSRWGSYRAATNCRICDLPVDGAPHVHD